MRNAMIFSGYPLPKCRHQRREGMKYILFRMDDNGQRAVVEESEDYENLQNLQGEFERRGHKQTYWMEAERINERVKIPDGVDEQ